MCNHTQPKAAFEIGIVEHDTNDERDITAAEYIAEGPANEWGAPIDVEEFFESNEEIEEDERAEIMAALTTKGRYFGGGGAACRFQLIAIPV